LRNAATVRLLHRAAGGSAIRRSCWSSPSSLAAQQETLADLRKAMLITAPLALLVASLGGYVLARRASPGGAE